MRELFHFDIETANEYPDFDTFRLSDERGSDIFIKKYEKMGWSEKWTSVEEAYLKTASVVSTFGKIVCISFGYLKNNGEPIIKSIYGEDEKQIVSQFNDVLKKIEEKNFNLCGFRIINFDIPCLLHKLHKYQIKPCDIIYTYDKKPWEMRITDISEDWRGKFAWSFSFDEVSYQLGLDSPKLDMDGSKVNSAYWEGKIEDIKNYCELDVKSSIEISKMIYPL